MTSLPELRCKTCGGTGVLDAGTEDECQCPADHCEDGTLMCSWCSDNSGASEPAVGEHFVFGDGPRGEGDHVIPGCRMHLLRAKAYDAREDRGDYERDMARDGQ